MQMWEICFAQPVFDLGRLIYSVVWQLGCFSLLHKFPHSLHPKPSLNAT